MIRCSECRSDQVERLAWVNVNEFFDEDTGKDAFRDWEKDHDDPHRPQIECAECKTTFRVADLKHMDDGS